MKTYLLTWNPKKWEWIDLPQAVCEANAEGKYLNGWSCISTKSIAVGDRAFLMRLGQEPKGIMGSGIIVSEPYEGLHWDSEKAAQGFKINRVRILFDILSDLPILSEEELNTGILASHNWLPQASGTRIPEEIATALESAWSTRTGVTFSQEDARDIPTLLSEGVRRTRVTTSYERNKDAREKCLQHYGSVCFVCGFSFESFYGSVGTGFIHVHHLVPVSAFGNEYEVNPVKDLRPVCPNCHAMLHKRTPPYSVEELRAKIDTSKSH